MAIDLYNNQYAPLPTKRLLRWFIAACLAIIVLVSFLWIRGHAYLEVSVQNSIAGNITYELLNQNTHKITSLTTSSNHIKQLVGSGNYEVSVNQNSSSSFSINKSGHFLASTAATVHLSAEEGRHFVGDNPGACMFYEGGLLLSGNCAGPLSGLRVHRPASATQPTITDSLKPTVNGSFEGIAKTGQGQVVLLQTSTGKHALYLMQADMSLSGGRTLDSLDTHKVYSIKPYDRGFLIYDSTFSQLLYFDSVTAQPQSINLPSLGKDYDVYASGFSGNALALAYTNAEDTDSTTKANTDKAETKVVLLQGLRDTKQFSFKTLLGSVAPCSDKLCVLTNKQMLVYSSVSGSPDLLYKVENILSLQNSANGLLLARDKQLLLFNVNDKTGYASYSYGNYSYCGLQPDDNGYSLCLQNKKAKKVALHIDAKTISDDIDKKVSRLLDSGDISNVSAYGSYIYISLVRGSLVYVPAQGYVPDPEALQTKRVNVNQLVAQLGINQKQYHIIITN